MPVETKPFAPEQPVDRTLHPIRRRIDCSGPLSWARVAPAPASPEPVPEPPRPRSTGG